MSDLKKCAGPGCSNIQDPRWGGFCDGHGPSTEEELQALLEGWRAQNEKVAKLEAKVVELETELNADQAVREAVAFERERAAKVVERLRDADASRPAWEALDGAAEAIRSGE